MWSRRERNLKRWEWRQRQTEKIKEHESKGEGERVLLSHAVGVLCRDYSLEGFYRFLAGAKREETISTRPKVRLKIRC